MAEEDICKTAIITPFGMFEFLRLPFGLRNTGNTFQRMMDSILGNLPYCFTYVDDILIFSSSLEQHVDHLREVLLLCRQHGLTIGLPKCEFAVPKISFWVISYLLRVALLWSNIQQQFLSSRFQLTNHLCKGFSACLTSTENFSGGLLEY